MQQSCVRGIQCCFVMQWTINTFKEYTKQRVSTSITPFFHAQIFFTSMWKTTVCNFECYSTR
jgi:hypothetical protein